MRKNRIWLYLLLISFGANAQSVTWDGQNKFVNIASDIAILEDPTNQLTIQQISSQPYARRFVKSNKPILNFAVANSTYWLRFSVLNKTSQSVWLELAQAFLPIAELYYQENGTWRVLKQGYRNHLHQKEVKHHFQVFPLPDSSTPIYIRLISYQHPIPVKLWHKQSFEIKVSKQNIVYGIFLGILFFVLINNLFLFFSLNRINYLSYAAVTFMHILIVCCVMDGYILYLFPQTDLMYWYNFLPITNMVITTLYGICFLEVKTYNPVLYRIAFSFLIYFSVFLIVHHFLPVTTVLIWNQVNALLSLGLALIMGLQTGRRGNRIGYYFAFAYFVYFAIVIVQIIYQQSGNPAYLFDISHVSIAIFFEVLILSFALSKRFEWERKDMELAKTEAQRLLLEKTRENERLLLVQNETLEREVAERTRDIEQKSLELQQSLDHLRATQDQLVQKEKMASLGELTAGIAHEIQNPLNFVNNFSKLSIELVEELKEDISTERKEAALELTGDLHQNLEKIAQHGKRADLIVKSMMEHSRASTSAKRPTNLTTLAEEYLRIAYQGFRAKDSAFMINTKKEFAPDLPDLNVVPQEIGRVLHNLYNNAFYALQERQKAEDDRYTPTLTVCTKWEGPYLVIQVRDNGTGMPESVQQKAFQPFFTTKPTGFGNTGLGLSLAYDIITKGHEGRLEVVSHEGQGTEMTIRLPV